jgi:acyl-CoA thioester hydrolase
MPFSYPIDVRFSDLDALGHVNHAVIISYLEHARHHWWQGLIKGKPFEEEGYLIARVEVDYRESILINDKVIVTLRCESIGTSSFTLAFQVRDELRDVVFAEARIVQVMLDFKTQRSRPIGDETLTWLRSQL